MPHCSRPASVTWHVDHVLSEDGSGNVWEMSEMMEIAEMVEIVLFLNTFPAQISFDFGFQYRGNMVDLITRIQEISTV